LPLFDRVVEVLIGKKGSEQTLRVTDLRVTFAVKKSSTKDVNSARVDIFNLSPDLRSRIRKTEDVLILKAGYAQDTGPEILYRGDITLVQHVKQLPNIITRIESGDGTQALMDTRVSLTYKAGTSAKQIIRDLLKKFPIAEKSALVNKVLNSIPEAQYANGFAASGLGKDALDEVTEKLGLEWSIQDNEFKLLVKGGTDGSRAILISPTTGMIEAPERSLNIIKKSKKRGITKDIPGWTVKSLLQPKIEPGGVVSIESAEIPAGSAFRVESIEHKGDTHSMNQWTSEMDVTDVSG
jgi:hypothetical protein